MKKKDVARGYAKAIVDIGMEEGNTREIEKELIDLNNLFTATPEIYNVLPNPLYPLEERQRFIETICEKAETLRPVKMFMALLVESCDIAVFPEICDAYKRMEDEISGRIKIIIETPFELEHSLLQDIGERIKAMTGKKEVVMETKQDPELLGSIVIRYENKILDGSLETQLRILREKIEGVAQ